MALEEVSTSSTVELIVDEDDVLKNLLTNFPPISYAVGYGSSVFPQKNQQRGKMIDLIFIVENPEFWHSENLKLNPHHYSFLKYFGSRTITLIQENLACRVYYNTYANVNNKILKYGVIGTQAVLDDLKNWTHAYVPGRLHKPVRELCPALNPELVKLLRVNHEFALRASLLQLPKRSTLFDLYYAIAELSYIGDSRMIMGEHPNKVQNIVTSNMSAFDEIYQPLLSKMTPAVKLTRDNFLIQDKSPASIRQQLISLPSHLQQHICHKYKAGGIGLCLFTSYDDIDIIMNQLSKDQTADIPVLVREAIGHLIWVSSLRQTLCGFLSTGVLGSLKYALEKFKKAFFPD